jgi:DNA polymerase-1
MEIEGIGLDAAYLKQLSNEFSIKISLLEKEIWELAGTNFNIASHKQVGEILFEKMLLPYGKILKKSKSYMTDVDILEKLENQGYKIASLLLQFRQLSKLKNTYSDNLVKQINHKTGRIHTKFSQTVTTTARLSSSEPNLQNIPIRDEEGRRIRQAFVAKANHKLISFDYSQIELKILASMANVAGLKEAFNNDRDVHIETAMNIFNLKLDDVNTEYRRKAKTINFGVIYGIGAFGLSKQLNISRPVAAKYIEKYFEKYPEIKNYMEDTINFAKKNLYVKNLFGRKCFTPLINDSKHAMRQFAERAAINAPIQSTSADIIKIAMINIDKMLTSSNFKTKLLLQIHDELIFEAPISEVDIIIPLIKNIMEDFTNIMTVKTTIDYKFGDNLDEIK